MILKKFFYKENINTNININKLNSIQNKLKDKIILKDYFNINEIQLCAGIDVSYWSYNDKTIGGCSIVVLNYNTKEIVEKKECISEIKFPYISGYLAFRELPLVLKTIKTLNTNPDIFIFDGNGYLHENHMGLATHASFYLNKPTIGVAKNYLKINNINFTCPKNKIGSFEDIVVNNEIYGRVLRTKENAKPIFISCGNYICIDSCTKIVMNFISKDSRVILPTRLADIETHLIKKNFTNNSFSLNKFK